VSDTTRTVLIALGVALLVVAVVPFLFMGGMMATMMGGGVMGSGMMGGGPWVMGVLVLIVLAGGVILLITGLRRPGQPGGQG